MYPIEGGGYYGCSPVLKRCRFSPESSKQEEEKKKDMKLSFSLPDELVIEILEWLPIKSLARFRCVAKPWSAIFKGPTFIRNHRRKRGSKGTMLLVRRCLLPPQFDDNAADALSFHDLDSPEAEVRPSLSITFFKDLVGLQRVTTSQFNLVGSCNGIVCVNYGNRYILCNPALREFKLIPLCSSGCPQGFRVKRVAQGFGVASCGYDFKVIVMHKVYEPKFLVGNRFSYIPNLVMVHLYSSRTNSWMLIDDAPVFPIVRFVNYMVFVNAACHWLGCTFARNHKTILSLDIDSEVFRQLELPDCLCRSDIADALPIVLNGCLGLVQCQRCFSKSYPVEIWAMREYGVKESWTKMFVLSPQPLARTFTPWKNDILMVHEPIFGIMGELRTQHERDGLDEQLNGRLASISLHTNEIKNFQVCGAQRTMRMLIYEESLVSLN